MKLSFCVILLASFAAVPAQTGGGYDMSHNVIGGGGGVSSGGTYQLGGTVGQPAAGTVSAGGSYTLRGGFWAFEQLAPTAALVGVSGRVMAASGTGLSGVTLTLTGPDGVVRSATSNSFGNFRFDDVAAGQTYVLTVASRRYDFPEPVRVLNVFDEVTDADFSALPF